MKRKQGLWLALAAGAALVGITAWLLTSKKGKEIRRKAGDKLRGQNDFSAARNGHSFQESAYGESF